MKEIRTIMPHSFISNVKMKGYKSIKDLECELQPGINVLIGKNGSGKTNFLEMMDMCLDMKAINSNKFSFLIKYILTDKDNFISNKSNQLFWKFSGEYKNGIIDGNGSASNGILVETDGVRCFSQKLFLPFNFPEQIFYLKDLVQIEHEIEGKQTSFNKLAMLPTSFIHEVFNESIRFHVEDLNLFDSDKEKSNFDKKIISKLEIDIQKLGNVIKKYTLIEDIRLHSAFNIKLYKNRIVFNNCGVEFLMKNDWYEWTQLSDGTKRILYLINMILNFEDSTYYQNPILIEEPELGIHPHQLHLLLQFLREQAKERQIVITTHSPQVLDILEKDELNNILIAEMKENGTQLRNLSERELAKATAYLKEDDLLSAFWRFSDFNRE